MAMKRSAAVTNQARPGGNVDWDEWSREVPTLFEFLTARTWDDGQDREPGAMLIFCDDGVLKAMLKDKAQERCAWVTGFSLRQLLLVADQKLLDDTADWRADKQAGKRKGK